MNQQSQSSLRAINFSIVGYFLALYTLYLLNIGGGFLQFFVELLTIPMVLAQSVFLVLGVIFLFKNVSGWWMKISVLALLISTVLTIGDIVMAEM